MSTSYTLTESATFTVTHARGNERARDFVPEGR